jgi:hypothetical protein
VASFLDLIGQTWPARLGRDFYQALTLPGDVYQGKVSMYGDDGHTNPEVIKRGADFASAMTLGTGAVPAEANALRAGVSLVKSGGMSAATPEMLEAYKLGQRMREARANWSASRSPTGSFDHDLAYGHVNGISEAEAEGINYLPPVLDAFYQSGSQGLAQPSFTRGSRFGDAPKDGRSWNYREQEYEPGVSIARVDHPDFKDYEWADMGGNRQRDLRHYEGWLLPLKGSDDEPLMVGLKAIQK